MNSTELLTKFLVSCGDQYMVDYVLDEQQIMTLDNFIDFVINKLEDIHKLEEKLKGKSNEKSSK